MKKCKKLLGVFLAALMMFSAVVPVASIFAAADVVSVSENGGNYAVVIDSGDPAEFDLEGLTTSTVIKHSSDTSNFPIEVGEITGEYGYIAGGVYKLLSYTPTKIVNGIDKFEYSKGNNAVDGEIDIIPASVMYYDDNFLFTDGEGNEGAKDGITFTGSWRTVDTDIGEAHAVGVSQKDIEELKTGRDLNNIVEYIKYLQALNALMKDNVGTDGKATFTFEFTGTGFELLSYIGTDAGIITASVDGESVSVSNYYPLGSIYRVPTISMQDLGEGSHTVTISVDWKTTIQSAGNFVVIDAIRIFNTLDDKSNYEEEDKNAELYRVIDLVKDQDNALDFQFLGTADDYAKSFALNEVYLYSGVGVQFTLDLTNLAATEKPIAKLEVKEISSGAAVTVEVKDGDTVIGSKVYDSLSKDAKFIDLLNGMDVEADKVYEISVIATSSVGSTLSEVALNYLKLSKVTTEAPAKAVGLVLDRTSLEMAVNGVENVNIIGYAMSDGSVDPYNGETITYPAATGANATNGNTSHIKVTAGATVNDNASVTITANDVSCVLPIKIINAGPAEYTIGVDYKVNDYLTWPTDQKIYQVVAAFKADAWYLSQGTSWMTSNGYLKLATNYPGGTVTPTYTRTGIASIAAQSFVVSSSGATFTPALTVSNGTAANGVLPVVNEVQTLVSVTQVSGVTLDISVDENTATVTLTGAKAGTAVIELSYGSLAPIQVNVTVNPEPSMNGIVADRESVTVEAEKTTTIKIQQSWINPTVTKDFGSDADYFTFDFNSDKIDAVEKGNGVIEITGIAEGETALTVTYLDYPSIEITVNVTATTNISLVKPADITFATALFATGNLKRQSFYLQYMVDGDNSDIRNVPKADITLPTSSDFSVTVADDGLITVEHNANTTAGNYNLKFVALDAETTLTIKLVFNPLSWASSSGAGNNPYVGLAAYDKATITGSSPRLNTITVQQGKAYSPNIVFRVIRHNDSVDSQTVSTFTAFNTGISYNENDIVSITHNNGSGSAFEMTITGENVGTVELVFTYVNGTARVQSDPIRVIVEEAPAVQYATSWDQLGNTISTRYSQNAATGYTQINGKSFSVGDIIYYLCQNETSYTGYWICKQSTTTAMGTNAPNNWTGYSTYWTRLKGTIPANTFNQGVTYTYSEVQTLNGFSSGATSNTSPPADISDESPAPASISTLVESSMDTQPALSVILAGSGRDIVGAVPEKYGMYSSLNYSSTFNAVRSMGVYPTMAVSSSLPLVKDGDSFTTEDYYKMMIPEGDQSDVVVISIADKFTAKESTPDLVAAMESLLKTVHARTANAKIVLIGTKGDFDKYMTKAVDQAGLSAIVTYCEDITSTASGKGAIAEQEAMQAVVCDAIAKAASIELKNDEVVAEWTQGASYKIGDVVVYNGVKYECVVAHEAKAVAWNPISFPQFWKSIA